MHIQTHNAERRARPVGQPDALACVAEQPTSPGGGPERAAACGRSEQPEHHAHECPPAVAEGGAGAVKRYGMGAEEPAYYHINLLSLFGDRFSNITIRGWAERAAEGRAKAIRAFDDRLRRVGAAFDLERQRSGERPARMPDLALQGWEQVELTRLRECHGGLLVALFHFGSHREVCLDLASMAVPYIAPVAKQAYFNCVELMARGPEAFADAMRLVAVEDPRVGRQLLSGLRAGRIGLIYVDGNMGPEGDRVEEGAVEVDFVGRRIKVKAGIARLSQALRIPVLPLFVDRPEDARCPPSVRAGGLLMPPENDDARATLMQRLYDSLAEAVTDDPAAWEFAFCLHRWIVDAPFQPQTIRVPSEAPLAVQTRRVALLQRDAQDYWVHVGRQRAFALPMWAQGLYERLTVGTAKAVEIHAWLLAQGAPQSDARKLLAELLERDLLVEVGSE